MESVARSGLSQPLMRAQRALANLLDRQKFDPTDAFLARRCLAALPRGDLAQAQRWLAWQSLTRNQQALSRIQRLDPRLAAAVLHARGRLPDAIALTQVAGLQRSA